MMTPEDFKRLMAEIQSLGYNENTAGYYAYLIGDTPVLDKDGNVVVKDDGGKVLARLKLKFFGGQ